MEKIIKWIPNILSFSRIGLCTLTVYILLSQLSTSIHFLLVLILLFGVKGATDYYDGKIARRLKLESKFGARLDELADKLTFVTMIYAIWKLNYHFNDIHYFTWHLELIVYSSLSIIFIRDLTITIIRFLFHRINNILKIKIPGYKKPEIGVARGGKLKTVYLFIGTPVIILSFWIYVYLEYKILSMCVCCIGILIIIVATYYAIKSFLKYYPEYMLTLKHNKYRFIDLL